MSRAPAPVNGGLGGHGEAAGTINPAALSTPGMLWWRYPLLNPRVNMWQQNLSVHHPLTVTDHLGQTGPSLSGSQPRGKKRSRSPEVGYDPLTGERQDEGTTFLCSRAIAHRRPNFITTGLTK